MKVVTRTITWLGEQVTFVRVIHISRKGSPRDRAGEVVPGVGRQRYRGGIPNHFGVEICNGPCPVSGQVPAATTTRTTFSV